MVIRNEIMTDSENTQKFCLITGANRGFGKVLSLAFWKQGWSLILVGKNASSLKDLVNLLPLTNNQTAHIVIADLAEDHASTYIIECAKSYTLKLDALINNAAIQGPIGYSWEVEWSWWKKTLQINLLTPIALCRKVSHWMIEHNDGSIINISGGGATAPRPHFNAYATAKAGLVRFSETLSVELAAYNIRINCLAPGAMATDMQHEILALPEHSIYEKEKKTAYTIIKQNDSMTAAIDLALFLTSPSSQNITGKVISALWDNWKQWPHHLDQLCSSDIYTLRRISGKDRNMDWGDK